MKKENGQGIDPRNNSKITKEVNNVLHVGMKGKNPCVEPLEPQKNRMNVCHISGVNNDDYYK